VPTYDDLRAVLRLNRARRTETGILLEPDGTLLVRRPATPIAFTRVDGTPVWADPDGRLLTRGIESWRGKDTARDASASSPDISTDMEIGDSGEVFALVTGADAIITLTADSNVYVMEYVVAHCEMAAVAATRTLVIGLRAGLTQRGWASARDEYVSATLTQTTGEFGSISWLPNGVEAVNDNGTFTRTVGGSPLPLPFYNEAAFQLALDGTTLNAADTLGISMIVRRIA